MPRNRTTGAEARFYRTDALGPGSDLHSTAAWLQRCAPYCFPNEVALIVPDVGLRGDEPYLRLDTLKRLRNALTQGVTWSRTFTADGVSRQFAVD
jgi:hypothetical protein